VYFDELKKSMDWLAQKSDTVFIGQAVAVPGTAMFGTLKDISRTKIIELPVAEEMQLGMSIGFAMDGKVPISVYPRWNFLLLAVNQLVNHLDQMRMISNSGYRPKVIIRTGIGSERPLHPQHQHIGDFSEAFGLMLKNINVIRLEEPDQIFETYKNAYERDDGQSSLIVEYGDYYNEK
jgi:pyruvate/2-oxoglutarate/acetoin dehydrogenase E1 component